MDLSVIWEGTQVELDIPPQSNVPNITPKRHEHDTTKLYASILET